MSNIIISATANGSLTPDIADFPNVVVNGDFTITGHPSTTVVGNGVDESTSWNFNFQSHPNYIFFTNSRPLISAKLTLSLLPKDRLITTDFVRIQGLPNIITPIIQGLPENVPSTIEIDLLAEGYSSSDILNTFFQASVGEIPMYYIDDAILCSAKLELVQQVPVYQYVVKFICGKGDGKIVSKGNYFTAINVHNPFYSTEKFRIKVAVANPHLSPGPVSSFTEAKLGPDQAFEIDCEDIFKLSKKEENKKFLKGFVIIESDKELDIVSVYTASDLDGAIESLEIETIRPRIRRVRVPQPPIGNE